MTAFVWVYCREHPPYNGHCPSRWPVKVESTAEALTIAEAAHPGAPPLAAQIVIDCEHGRCCTRIRVPGAATIAEARQVAAARAGWFTVAIRNRTADHCQFHIEPAHPHLLPGRAGQPPAQPEQLGLFTEVA